MSIETVKVVTDDDYKIINKSDMKESDKIYKEQDKPAAKKKKAD